MAILDHSKITKNPGICKQWLLYLVKMVMKSSREQKLKNKEEYILSP